MAPIAPLAILILHPQTHKTIQTQNEIIYAYFILLNIYVKILEILQEILERNER